MYHQFIELAEVDITKDEMEVGPTCHYVMGGIPTTVRDTRGSDIDGACGQLAAAPEGTLA